MKFKTFMPVLALACVCAVGQADAAQDRLMMPEQPAEPLNVIEAEVAVPVPSEEVRDVVNAFTQFQLDQKGKRIMDDSRVMTGQERYRKQFPHPICNLSFVITCVSFECVLSLISSIFPVWVDLKMLYALRFWSSEFILPLMSRGCER